MNRLTNTAAVLALGFTLMAPIAVFAQEDVTPIVAPATIVISGADGAEVGTYSVTDISVYLSTIAAVDDQPAYTDFSLSLSSVSPLDAALLEWASQTNVGDAALRNISITVAVTDAEGGEPHDMQYEVKDAKVTSLSTSHSSYTMGANVSLQVAAGKLTIDGIAVN